MQYVKDTKIEEACSDLFGDTNPWFASEEEKKKNNNLSHMNATKTCFNKQLTYKVQRKRNGIKLSRKCQGMVRSATTKLNLIETHVKLNMQIGNHKIHESPRSRIL